MSTKQEIRNQAAQWARLTRGKLAMKVMTMSFKDRLHLANEFQLRRTQNIKTTLEFAEGAINDIVFSFPYQGWFVEHGTRKGVKKGSPKANPRPWLSAIIPSETTKFANQLVEAYGDHLIYQLSDEL